MMILQKDRKEVGMKYYKLIGKNGSYSWKDIGTGTDQNGSYGFVCSEEDDGIIRVSKPSIFGMTREDVKRLVVCRFHQTPEFRKNI